VYTVLCLYGETLIYITLDGRLNTSFVPFERWAKIEVVVCLMWAVDVLSNILEILCIIELYKVAKVFIILLRDYFIKIKLLNELFIVSCYGFLTKNSPIYFGGAVEL